MTTLKTIETDFAAAMMARGARLEGWHKTADGRKLYWELSGVNPEWQTAYRDGKDGIMRAFANRRQLVNIAKTETETAKPSYQREP